MIVTQTNIQGIKKHAQGKVRDVYDLGDAYLMIATDRLSAFDVVLPNGIPDKGKVLTQISLFWFEKISEIITNHVISADIEDLLAKLGSCGVESPEQYKEMLDGRSMLVVKAQPTPIECVVRGYLAGSAWKEYSSLRESSSGSSIVLHGVELPSDMTESQVMPVPVFTPATKETSGHDINISAERAREIVGRDIGMQLEAVSLAIYKFASKYAAERGIIICDTKFEFGLYNNELIIIDEVLTPDSSRFWAASDYTPGSGQASFDKQFVRDYLLTLDWDKTYPGPALPEEVVQKTTDKYREAYYRIVGKELD